MLLIKVFGLQLDAKLLYEYETTITIKYKKFHCLHSIQDHPGVEHLKKVNDAKLYVGKREKIEFYQK